jgi:elongation factor Ts
MKITTQMVKELREAAGAGVMEAKKALEATNGDFDAAIEILRTKGAERAEERSDRAAKEGLIEMYAHPGNRVGVMLEINSETDFVARNESFQVLAHDLALHIAAMAPIYVTQEDVPSDVVEKMTEQLKAEALSEGKPEAIVGKIIKGKMRKYFEESCLLEQPFVKDEDVLVKDLITEAIRTTGENIIVRRFARYELGEDLV